MNADYTNIIPKPNPWFTTEVIYAGQGQAWFRGLNSPVVGPATVRFDEAGVSHVEMQAQGVIQLLTPLGFAEYVALMQVAGWKLSAVRDAAGHFGCSVIAAAFSFTHHYPGPCTVLVCEYGYLRKEPTRAGQLIQTQQGETAMCLFVAYSIHNHRQKYPMCRNIPVPRMHLIHQTWLDCGEASGKDIGFFKNGNGWRIHCEVICLRGRAYAAYLPDGPVKATFDESQLSLL